MALLEYKEKYQTSSASQATTTSTTLVDDPYASLTFMLDQPCTVLIIYAELEVYGGASLRWGNETAICIDGVDYSLVAGGGKDSGHAMKNTTFWVGTLDTGSHTIKGRFSSMRADLTAVINQRTLLAYVFYGDEFTFITDATSQTTNSLAFVDDSYASATITPSGSCKALVLYAISNDHGATEADNGKKIAISIAGSDYAQAEQSKGMYGQESIFTAWALSRTAVSTAIKGRVASNGGATVTVNRRHLGILFLKDTTLLDALSNTTAYSTTSNSLVDDPNATINRTTTDSRELLVIGIATRRNAYDKTGSEYGERYGLKVDSNDRAQCRSSPCSSVSATANSCAMAWAETLSAAAHTIKGRISTNNSTYTAQFSARIIIALWFVPTPPRRRLVCGSGSFVLSGKSVGLKSNRKISPGAGSFALTGYPVNLKLYHDKVLICSQGHFNLSGSPVSLLHDAILSLGPGSFEIVGNDVYLQRRDPYAHIVFDAQANSSWSQGSSITWNHTVGEGRNRMLVVGITVFNLHGEQPTCESVTYGGAVMNKVVALGKSDSNSYWWVETSIWMLKAPDTGTHEIVASISGTPDDAAGVSCSYIGVRQISYGVFTSDYWLLTGGRPNPGHLFITPAVDLSWIFAVGGEYSQAQNSYYDPEETDRGSSDHWQDWNHNCLMAEDCQDLPIDEEKDVASTYGYNLICVMAAVLLEPAPIYEEEPLPQPSGIYHDASSELYFKETGEGSGNIDYTFSHACSLDANRLLIVGVVITGPYEESLLHTAWCWRVKYNGVAMTQVYFKYTSDPTDTYFVSTRIFMMKDPPAGVHDVIVSIMNNLVSYNVAAASCSYYGCFQVNQYNAVGFGHTKAIVAPGQENSWIFAIGGLINDAATFYNASQKDRGSFGTIDEKSWLLVEDSNGPVGRVGFSASSVHGSYKAAVLVAIAFGQDPSYIPLPPQPALPIEAPHVDDGLYIIERKAQEPGAGELKVLSLTPYNDKWFNFHISPASGYDSWFPTRFNWSWGNAKSWPHSRFLGPDPDLMLIAFWSNGMDIFKILSNDIIYGEITNVSVQAYVKGRCRTVLLYHIPYQHSRLFKGGLSIEKPAFSWVKTDYPVDPLTNEPWTVDNLVW
jgi:hypothetical protein